MPDVVIEMIDMVSRCPRMTVIERGSTYLMEKLSQATATATRFRGGNYVVSGVKFADSTTVKGCPDKATLHSLTIHMNENSAGYSDQASVVGGQSRYATGIYLLTEQVTVS